jgi:xanthine dehydrogenase YagS FAD-binding subunit
MHPFELVRASDVTQAIQGAAENSTAQQGGQVRFVAGGTTLIDLMKLNVEKPQKVIDRLPLDKVEVLPDGTGRWPFSAPANTVLRPTPRI